MFDIIKTFTELPGPGGDEWAVQEYLKQRWSPKVQDIDITAVGNLFATVGGTGPRLMIAAHADELCFVVRYISEDGFIWLSTGQRSADGPIALRSTFLPWGLPALIATETGNVEGVFATLTGHVLTTEQRAKSQWDWNDIWVDVGVSSRAGAEDKGIQVGDRVIWNPPTRRMGDFVYGKAMDDRVCHAVMDRLLDVIDTDALAYELIYVSTVQEEIGLVGAESASDRVSDATAIALDVGLVSDVPGVDPSDAPAVLGGGPCIVHKDLYHYNRPLTLSLMKAARDAKIPVQPAVFNLYGSDAGAFARHGLASALITIPTRYTHSPFEMVHLHDVEQTVALLKHFLETQP